MYPHRPQTSFHTPPIFPPLPRPKRPPSRTPSPTRSPSPPPPTPPRHALHSGPRPPPHILAHLSAHSLPAAPLPPSTLQQRHTATLTTLLHHALSRHDLPRALRAFALLLRTPHTDLRALWRLGATLLLRTARPAAAAELLERLALLHPYNKGTHALHAALNGGVECVRGGLLRPCVLEFVPGLLETLVVGGEGVERRREVWARVEAWMVGPPWAEVRVLWLWRGMVAAWCADGEGVGGEERRRWRAEAESAWRGFVQRGGELPGCVRWPEEEEGGDGGEEDGGEGGEEEEV